MSNGNRTQERGQQGRPSTAEIVDPQAAKEAQITAIFKSQFRQLAALFPADGETMVARARASAINAAREWDQKKGAYKLASVSAEAIAEKAIACHHLGLELGDQAYLVPYGADLQLIIGPRGLIALMFRSGFVKDVSARAVFDGDLFDYDLGTDQFLKHKKSLTRRPAEKKDVETFITNAYVIIRTSTGGTILEVLTAEDIAYYRSFSKMKGGAWAENFEGMCRKTAIHRGAEFVPRSPVLSAALRENEQGGYQIPEEVLAAVRGKVTIPGDTGAPLPPTEPEMVYQGANGGQARESGQEG